VIAVEWAALGTEAVLAVTESERLPEARAAVNALLADFDQACSRFRDDSELSRLNRAAGGWVSVGPVLFRAVMAAIWAAGATAGAVDPTIGRTLRISGYDRDFKAINTRDAPLRLRAAASPGWRAIQVDSHGRRIRLPPGVELDLGATAKALAADRAAAAALLAVSSKGGVLVSLGGDVALSGKPPSEGWIVQVAESPDALEPSRSEVVSIHDGGLATSSTSVRRWTRGGVQMHHILDPATGQPAAGHWRTASVAAASCLEANAAATAAIVQGTRAVAWLQARRLPARLVGRSGHVLRLAGWPAR
jgi:thiamine biosynthesis lipoprotein